MCLVSDDNVHTEHVSLLFSANPNSQRGSEGIFGEGLCESFPSPIGSVLSTQFKIIPDVLVT